MALADSHLLTPHLVYVLIQKDRQGAPRGMEKSTGKFYATPVTATADLNNIDPTLRDHYTITPCVIMGLGYFNGLMNDEKIPLDK